MRRGSVLAEFVIVAPLYFVLLGGLLFVGEVSLNRLRMLVGDHAVTWLAATRFTQNRDDIAPLLGDYLFADAMQLVGLGVVSPDYDKVNGFVAMYKGGIKRLSISMPAWAHGMLSMQEIMTGGDVAASAVYDYLNDKDYQRSYSFHRHARYPDNLDRDVAAESLIQENILMNVLVDDWILSESHVPADSASSSMGHITRALSGWSE